jgi:hypothetical protein
MTLARIYEAELKSNGKARPTGIDDFALSLRASVRGLWAGRRGLFDFVDNMVSILNRHLENAWREGAAECGIRPDERTPEETARLQDFINGQIQFVPAFGQFIAENSKAEGGLLRTSLKRLPPWINRYNEVKAIATTMACADEKYQWFLGQTVEHCRTCLKLNGRVMRGSRWRELDVHPQDTRPGKLECRGFNCDCRLRKTGRRVTPGPLPKLP